MTEELFTTTMRKATRKAHAISDALVNAKLLFGKNFLSHFITNIKFIIKNNLYNKV